MPKTGVNSQGGVFSICIHKRGWTINNLIQYYKRRGDKTQHQSHISEKSMQVVAYADDIAINDKGYIESRRNYRNWKVKQGKDN